jgi:Tol biopolymer transport system component
MAAGLRHVEDPPPDLAARRPDVPEWLARAVRRLLAKEPADRPADAAAALALLAGPPRRGRRPLLVAGGLAAAAAGGVVFWLATRDRAGAPVPPSAPAPEWRPAVVEPQPAYEENGEAPAISPDGRWLALAGDRERTGHFRIYVSPLAGGPGRAITPPERNTVSARWTRDGDLLVSDATAGEPISVWRYRLAGGAPEKITNGGRAEDCNGRLLIEQRTAPGCPACDRLVLREAGGGEREVLRLAAGEALIGFRCDRAGERVVFARAPEWSMRPAADLWLLSLAGGSPRRLTSDGKQNTAPVFHPDGRSVLFSSARAGAINLWELPLAGGDPVRVTAGEGDDLGADISPDGSTLVFDVDITWRPLFAGSPDGTVRRITSTRPVLEAPAATADGREVIATDLASGRKRIVAIATADGSERELAEGDLGAPTPDGAEVVYVAGGRPARVLARPRGGGPPRTLGSAPATAVGLRVGGDGWVYLALADGGPPEPWRMPLAGGAIERAAAAPICVTLVAPAGGWRFEATCDLPRVRGALIPPGGKGRRRTVTGERGDFDPGGKAFLYAEHGQVHRIDLASGADTLLFAAPDLAEMTAAADGTVYYTELVGRVRRQLITNFGERPRP